MKVRLREIEARIRLGDPVFLRFQPRVLFIGGDQAHLFDRDLLLDNIKSLCGSISFLPTTPTHAPDRVLCSRCLAGLPSESAF